jgi:hypothetical protein
MGSTVGGLLATFCFCAAIALGLIVLFAQSKAREISEEAARAIKGGRKGKRHATPDELSSRFHKIAGLLWLIVFAEVALWIVYVIAVSVIAANDPDTGATTKFIAFTIYIFIEALICGAAIIIALWRMGQTSKTLRDYRCHVSDQHPARKSS